MGVSPVPPAVEFPLHDESVLTFVTYRFRRQRRRLSASQMWRKRLTKEVVVDEEAKARQAERVQQAAQQAAAAQAARETAKLSDWEGLRLEATLKKERREVESLRGVLAREQKARVVAEARAARLAASTAALSTRLTEIESTIASTIGAEALTRQRPRSAPPSRVGPAASPVAAAARHVAAGGKGASGSAAARHTGRRYSVVSRSTRHAATSARQRPASAKPRLRSSRSAAAVSERRDATHSEDIRLESPEPGDRLSPGAFSPDVGGRPVGGPRPSSVSPAYSADVRSRVTTDGKSSVRKASTRHTTHRRGIGSRGAVKEAFGGPNIESNKSHRVKRQLTGAKSERSAGGKSIAVASRRHYRDGHPVASPVASAVSDRRTSVAGSRRRPSTAPRVSNTSRGGGSHRMADQPTRHRGSQHSHGSGRRHSGSHSHRPSSGSKTAREIHRSARYSRPKSTGSSRSRVREPISAFAAGSVRPTTVTREASSRASRDGDKRANGEVLHKARLTRARASMFLKDMGATYCGGGAEEGVKHPFH